MLGLSLFFIGAVLLVNGIGLTGRIEARDTAVFNLLVGLLVLLINGIGLVRGHTTADYRGVAGGLLFGFTYLYLAVVQWFNLPGKGLGWYCLFVAINTLLFAALAVSGGDMRGMLLWLLWGVLWLLFFLDLALAFPVKRILPTVTILVGIVTCWIPGGLMLTGFW